jgi:hypothetical protein
LRPYLEKALHKRAGGMAQGVGPEFKPQYPKIKIKKKRAGGVAVMQKKKKCFLPVRKMYIPQVLTKQSQFKECSSEKRLFTSFFFLCLQPTLQHPVHSCSERAASAKH